MFHHIIHKVLESKFQSNIKYTCQRIIRAGALTRFRVSPFESGNSNQIISIYIQPAIIHLQFLHEREIEIITYFHTFQTQIAGINQIQVRPCIIIGSMQTRSTREFSSECISRLTPRCIILIKQQSLFICITQRTSEFV